MSRWVIDASVACQLLLPEPLTASAERVIAKANYLYAPDFMRIEVANALWKRIQRGELALDDAQLRLAELMGLEIQLSYADDLLLSAMELAAASKRTIYDSCYIALARSLELPCVTADKRLVNALRHTPFADLAVWLGDM